MGRDWTGRRGGDWRGTDRTGAEPNGQDWLAPRRDRLGMDSNGLVSMGTQGSGRRGSQRIGKAGKERSGDDGMG
jgi:hypothetical protein